MDLSLVILIIIGLIIMAIVEITNRVKNFIVSKQKKKRKEKWYQEIEPAQRNLRDYPDDWERRRTLVYLRSDGRCQNEGCGKKCSYMTNYYGDIWSVNDNCRLVHGGQVHHIIPMSKGGTHLLDNLQLLCDECHAAKHPENKRLAKIVNDKVLKNIQFGKHPRVVKARAIWKCEVCSKKIYENDLYYGDRLTKVCMKCCDQYGIEI